MCTCAEQFLIPLVLACLISYSAWLWPGKQHLSSRDHDVCCWKLHAAIWRRLREQSRFQPNNRDLSEHVWTIWRTDISRGSEMLLVWCWGRTYNCLPLFSPLTHMGWGGDFTGYNCPRCWISPQTQEGRHQLWGHIWLQFRSNYYGFRVQWKDS